MKNLAFTVIEYNIPLYFSLTVGAIFLACVAYLAFRKVD